MSRSGAAAGWLRAGAGAALALSLVLAWSVARDMYGLIGQPVPGFVLFVNGAIGPPFLAPGGGAYSLEQLRVSHRIVAVDGVPVAGASEIWDAAARAGPGAALRYTLESPTGERVSFAAQTRVFSWADYRDLVLPLLLGGLLLLAVGSVPILARPELANARIFFLFCWASVTNYCFLAYDHFVVHRFVPYGYAFEALATAGILHFALAFPVRRWPLAAHPGTTLAVAYGLPSALALVYVYALRRAPALMVALDYVALPLYLLGFLLLTLNAASAALRAPSALERQRARVVLIGPALVLLAGVALVTMAMSWRDLGVPTVVYVLLGWTLPVTLAYGLLRHNLFELNTVVRRGLSFGLLFLAIALGYVGGFALLQDLVGIGTAWTAAATAIVLLGVLIPVVGPLRRLIETIVESTLFPGYRRSVAAVHAASREVARLRDPDEVAAVLRRGIDESVAPRHVRILAGSEGAAVAELAPRAGEAPLVASPNDPLVGLLRRGRSLQLVGGGQGGSTIARDLQRHLERLGVELVVAFPPGEGCVGGFLLGPRSDSRLYTSDDRTILETLAAHSAAAIENAYAFEEMRRLQRSLTQQNVALRREVSRSGEFQGIIGRSPQLLSVLAQIKQVASTNASVLVIGETGTGKELLVRALHRLSARSERPLVQLACAAIPEALLESELFGHEKGAFTGATTGRAGRFEVADGGTLFLDDVDTLPLPIQAKLLRAIQEGEIQHLGSPYARNVDVRIVAATNKDLAAEVEAGRFREDLFYRLNVVPVRIPPLRERRDDIALLASHFVRVESEQLGREVGGIEPGTLEELEAHDWPGNVRELRNVIQRGVVMSSDGVFRLTESLGARGPNAREPASGRPLAERMRAYKIDQITQALERHGGHQRKAAAELGLHAPSLSRMIRELGIRVQQRGR